MSGKGDARLHARTQAPADDMAARWDRTFGDEGRESVVIPDLIVQAMCNSGGWGADVVEAYKADQARGEWVHPTLESWLHDAERNKAVRDALWRRIQRGRHGEGG